MAERKTKFIKGLYNWTFLSIVFAAIILINIISSFAYMRIDVTEDQRYSLAESTIDFLEKKESFKGRISVKIYLSGNLPAEIEHFKRSVEDKLTEFKIYAGDRIEYQFINPLIGTKEEQRELTDQLWDGGRGILPMDIVFTKDGTQSTLQLWPGAIINYGGAGSSAKQLAVQFLPGTKTDQPYQLQDMRMVIENSTKNLEYMLVSSLRRVILESKPRIGFLQGHGELRFAETQRTRAILSPYYSISDVELNDSIHALDGYDGLVIARPRSKFTEKDLYLIDQFVMRGGRLMCFIDRLNLPEDTLAKYYESPTSRIETGLDKLLFDYGLKLEDNYVMDARCMPKPVRLQNTSMIPWFFHVMATPTSHPTVRNLEPVSLKYTNEIKFVPKKNVAHTPILTSSTNSTVTGMAPTVSYMIPIQYGNEPLAANPDSDMNKRCLAGLAEGTFTSYFKNRIVDDFTKSPEINYHEKSEKEGKVVLIGNGRILQNRYDSMPTPTGNSFMYRPKPENDLIYDIDLIKARQPHLFGNQEFIQNLVDFMMGETSVLDIRSRQIDIHEIDREKVKADASFYKILNIGLPIALIIALAFIMNFIRKRKFAR
jgi:gliding-associated putative ABC transporter substrate-binding component GldG